MIKYLQLRVHRLECVKMTENRQNFLGIPLETDPDAIDIATIVTDPVHGMVAEGPVVYLGNRYTAGHAENFSPPKVIAEIPISDTDPFPRNVTVTMNMAEKDDGAGFSDLLNTLAQQLGDALSDAVGGELDRGITESEYYRLVDDTARDALTWLFREIGNLLGLGDDPFRPVSISHELRSFTDTPTGTAVATFREPNSAHHGEHRLTYGWTIAATPSMAAAPSGGTGRSSAALSGAGYAPAPYGRPFRSVRFARPMNKRAAVAITPPPRPATPARPGVAVKSATAVKAVRPWFWYPSVIKPLGAAKKP